MEAKVVISSCGHDGPFGATGVKRLRELGMVADVPGMKALDMNASEDAVVNGTRQVVPGLVSFHTFFFFFPSSAYLEFRLVEFVLTWSWCFRS
jgi:hypothetical protein